jgi:hypothetical protein
VPKIPLSAREGIAETRFYEDYGRVPPPPGFFNAKPKIKCLLQRQLPFMDTLLEVRHNLELQEISRK